MGCKTKTLLPTTQRLLLPKTIKPSVVREQLTKQKSKQKYYYDRHTRPLPGLKPGDKVNPKSQDIWKPTTVTTALKEPHTVTTQDGQTLRNHMFKKSTDCWPDNNSHHEDDTQGEQEPDTAHQPPHDLPREENNSTNSTPEFIEGKAKNVQTSNPSNVPLRRSIRDKKRPVRYDDTWSPHP